MNKKTKTGRADPQESRSESQDRWSKLRHSDLEYGQRHDKQVFKRPVPRSRITAALVRTIIDKVIGLMTAPTLKNREAVPLGLISPHMIRMKVGDSVSSVRLRKFARRLLMMFLMSFVPHPPAAWRSHRY